MNGNLSLQNAPRDWFTLRLEASDESNTVRVSEAGETGCQFLVESKPHEGKSGLGIHSNSKVYLSNKIDDSFDVSLSVN